MKLNEKTNWAALRNQAAIAAMQGTITILSSSDRFAFRDIVVEEYRGEKKTYPNEIADFAVACADALIAELRKEAKEELSQSVTKTGDKDDENVRKELIDFLWEEKIFLQEAHSSVENNPKYRFVMDAIAWLEKQKQ